MISDVIAKMLLVCNMMVLAVNLIRLIKSR